MGLNVAHGNMYGFVTHTYNTIKGKCPHGCTYCSIKTRADQLKQIQKEVRLDRSEFKTDLGEGNFIFVGSSCDMWAEGIPEDWITKTLGYLAIYDKNKYLLQTKNPQRFLDLSDYLISDDYIYCTTIETNRSYTAMGLAPDTAVRAMAMKRLNTLGFKTMVTVEPIFDFDLAMLQLYIEACRPIWVNIGADSKGHNLPEPSKEKVLMLIDALTESRIKIINKDNLKRLLNG